MSGPETALVSAAAARSGNGLSLRSHGRTGIRPLALGRLLAAHPRGHLLQARRLYPGPARARRLGLSGRPAAVSAVVAHARRAPQSRSGTGNLIDGAVWRSPENWWFAPT